MPLRLSPSFVRLSSAVVRSEDSRASYLKPALSGSDTARVVRGLQNVWRSTSTVEFEPLPHVTARWDATSVHDLRDYGDSTLNAIAAGRERTQLAGIDIGLERERTMAATVTYAPGGEWWVRPRLALGSTYAMLRDPNNRSIAIDAAPTDALLPRLSRRLGNTQLVTAATTFDPARAINDLTGEASRWRSVARAIRPIDVTFTRNQLSSFDGIPEAAGLGYQFGLGGIDAFRSLGDAAATSAGASSDLVISNAITLPGGLTISSRLQRGDARHWSRRDVSKVTVVNGDAITYPDISMRWSGRPILLSGIFSQLGATARALRTEQTWVTPSDVFGLPAEVREARQESYPFSANAVTAWGQVAISAAYAFTRRVDSLPGSLARRRSSDLAADIGKSFSLPEGWKVKNPLRTRVSWQESLTQSFVSNALAEGALSRLTDNGRRALNLNADTAVAENMTFSLQASRVVTFDRNLSRRFVQTVLTAVFQLQFFAGVNK
jgi:hypothetical protein